jgi:hypothetical protein
MKGTESFKKAISDHLNKLGEEDKQFAEKLKNPKKNIDDCVTYILNQVKASGCNGFADAEIFGMANHYYDEEDIKPGEKIKCDVVVNHKVELTPEEIEEAKKKAREKVIADEAERLRKKPAVKKPEPEKVEQPSLF